jgi:uncharacterized protein (DUF2147 family)
MKRLLLALSAAAIGLSPTSALAKSNLEGRWKNGAMQIVIAPCGRALCGTIVRASPKQQAKARRGSGTDLTGARLIDNIQPAGPGTWRANVFVADRNINARSTIQQVSPNRLTVRGCVLAVICKTTHWDRIG